MAKRELDTEDKYVRQFGERFIPQLFLCLRNAQLYSPDHLICQEAIQNLISLIHSFTRREANISLLIVREYFFLNDVRLKIATSNYNIFQSLLTFLSKRMVGTLTIEPDVNPLELAQFFQILANVDVTNELRFEFLLQEMEKHKITKVAIERLENYDVVEETDWDVIVDQRELAMATYFNTMEVLKEVYQKARANQKFDIRKIKHTVHAIVDSIMEQEYTLLALTQIKDYQHPIINHPTNVCVLSVAIGHQLGLRKKQLGDLGFCALLHDIGMVKIPKHILVKIGKRMTPDEQRILSRHTIYGAQILLQTKKMTPVMIRAVLVCFQHHVGDIYSKIVHRGNVDLFSKIVCIASAYNQLTTPQQGLPPMKPEVALNTLMEESGEFYDPVLIKVFINTIGKYPVGSMVKLNTGEVAVVLKPNPVPKQLERPIVKLISDAAGNPLEPIVIDLMEKDPNTKKYKRSIVELIDTTDFELEVDDYITVI